jgi:hypothetical protein
MTNIGQQPHIIHPDPRIMLQRDQPTVDPFQFHPSYNKSNNSTNDSLSYPLPHTSTPDIRRACCCHPVPIHAGFSYGHGQELGINLSQSPCASGSNVAGTSFQGRRSEDAFQGQALLPHTRLVRPTKRRRNAALACVDIHINPFEIQLPCGWNGCSTFISPDRMKIKHHLIRAHNVPTGNKLVTCVHPECMSDIKADSMWQHWLTHLGARIECDACHLTFAPRPDVFKRHVAVDGCPGYGRFIAGENSGLLR